MGWGTIYEGYLSKISPKEIDLTIEEIEEGLNFYKMRFLALAVASPRDLEDEKWEEYVVREIETLWPTLVDRAGLLGNLYQAQNSDKLESDL